MGCELYNQWLFYDTHRLSLLAVWLQLVVKQSDVSSNCYSEQRIFRERSLNNSPRLASARLENTRSGENLVALKNAA